MVNSRIVCGIELVLKALRMPGGKQTPGLFLKTWLKITRKLAYISKVRMLKIRLKH